jgi:DnaJ like chaperone protein
LYWGKIIGTLAGLATTRPLLALVGLLLGHQFDRGFAERRGAFRDADASLPRVDEAFVAALFRAMGCLAKIDGRVTEDEIRAARSVMHRLNLGPAQVRKAIHCFDEGKARQFDLGGNVRAVARKGARRSDERGLFLKLLLEMSYAKPGIGRRERAAIWTVCTELDIGRVELAQLEAMVRAQKSFRRSPAGDADRGRVSAAYRKLGVDPAATNDEIKIAYRRLMNRNHPDKIASTNPDAKAVADAERRTREVRTAYELLKARRSIR